MIGQLISHFQLSSHSLMRCGINLSSMHHSLEHHFSSFDHNSSQVQCIGLWEANQWPTCTKGAKWLPISIHTSDIVVVKHVPSVGLAKTCIFHLMTYLVVIFTYFRLKTEFSHLHFINQWIWFPNSILSIMGMFKTCGDHSHATSFTVLGCWQNSNFPTQVLGLRDQLIPYTYSG